MGEVDSDMMPEQFWWAFNRWASWNPMKAEKSGNWKIKGVESGNRTIVHVHVNPGMMAKNRSQCMCYYYFGDYEKTGVYEMIASDQKNEEWTDKWEKDGTFGNDIISEAPMNYSRVEARKDSNGKIIGSRVFQCNIFNPKGSIPQFALTAIAKAANKSVQRLVRITAEHTKEFKA